MTNTPRRPYIKPMTSKCFNCVLVLIGSSVDSDNQPEHFRSAHHQGQLYLQYLRDWHVLGTSWVLHLPGSRLFQLQREQRVEPPSGLVLPIIPLMKFHGRESNEIDIAYWKVDSLLDNTHSCLYSFHLFYHKPMVENLPQLNRGISGLFPPCLRMSERSGVRGQREWDRSRDALHLSVECHLEPAGASSL